MIYQNNNTVLYCIAHRLGCHCQFCSVSLCREWFAYNAPAVKSVGISWSWYLTVWLLNLRQLREINQVVLQPRSHCRHAWGGFESTALPSPPLPILRLGSLGDRLNSPQRVRAEHAAKRFFLVNFKLKIAHIMVLRSFSGYAITWSGINRQWDTWRIRDAIPAPVHVMQCLYGLTINQFR